MTPQESLELLYAVLRNYREYEQHTGVTFLTNDEYRKLFEVIVGLENRYRPTPQIYR